MNIKELKTYILDNMDNIAKELSYEDISKEKERYLKLIDKTNEKFGDGDYHIISSSGRSEIIGNHTDHQNGHVVACALNVDNIACVKKTEDNKVNIIDDIFGEINVDLTDLNVKEDEFYTSNALIRGVANRIVNNGYKIGGFKAFTNSNVLLGSGISSSACFEVMMVEIFNALYNDEKISDVNRAIFSKYAENVYFNKPSGLMDQMAISCGGFTAIDFKDTNNPVIEKIDFTFDDYDYQLVLVNTKGDHKDLSDEYGKMPNEMKDVAKAMGATVLSDKDSKEFYSSLKDIREKVKNDRAILRAYHFYNEDKRAVDYKKALENKDINEVLNLMRQSGDSSYKYLQNVYSSSRPNSQSLAIGLAIAEDTLKGRGISRVHGGGLEGTIQVICPKDLVNELTKRMNEIFGDDSVLSLKVRKCGTKKVC